MKPKKIEVGMVFFQSFKKMKATVTEINNNDVTIQYEDDTISNFFNKKQLKEFLQNTIDKEMNGYEMNIQNNNTWTNDMINTETSDINAILDHMKNSIDHNADDEWTDSRNEWIKKLPNQSKGKFAMNAYCCSMEAAGHVIEKNEKGEYAYGLERIAVVNDEKHIVRSALMTSDSTYITLNHLREDADWDKLICMIITPNETKIYEADRELVYLWLDENPDQIVWITKDDMSVVHWHCEYPMPEIFTKI